MAIVWLNGELLDELEAFVPALDRGVMWGLGLFETMRAYGGRVWALDDHMGRLCSGADVIELPVPGVDAMSEALGAVLRANGLEDAGVRITMTRGTGPPDPHLDPTGSPNVLVTAWRLHDYSDLYSRGAALVSIAGGGRPLAGLKTTSYAASVAGRIIASREGADDALFVGDGGRVFEATGANLFVLNGKRLTTPPLDDAILPGVTRKYVLDVAAGCGFETVEDVLRVDDLIEADEVLLTSSLREVYPVASVDGRDMRRGSETARLREAYEAYVLERLT